MNKFLKALAGLKQNKANLRKLAVFCVVVFGGALLCAGAAHAAELSVEGFKSTVMQIFIEWFVGLGEFCIKLTVFCLYFFIQLAKYNDYIDVPTVQLGWTMVRDVSNMFFVVVLLMISIGTILGLEQYQWNKTLVKLILAAVFINFSNLICGIFIDIAHVFTITFVNAVAATAGGNLIKMFSLDQMYSLIYQKPMSANAMFDVRLLIGAVAALIFAIFALFTMGAYLVVMIARVVVLWVLIILSPLAFIMQVIPQTQSYAKEWWDKFGKQVAVAPVIVFFLWLAFATAGQGNIATGGKGVGMGLEMEPLNQELGASFSTVQGVTDQKENETAAALSEVTTWQSMSNFLIPMGLLLVGVGVVGKMGVVGGGAVTKATEFAKKAAMLATGYAAGRWLAGKGVQGAKAVGGGLVKGAKAVGWYGIQGDRIKNRIAYEYSSFQQWRKHGGWQSKLRRDAEGNIEYAKDQKTGELLKDKEGKFTPLYETRDEEGKETGVVQMEYAKPEGIKGHLQRFLSKRVEKEAYGIKRRKRMEDFEKNREEMMQSHISANPSHKFWMSDAERKGAIEVRTETKDEKTGEIKVKMELMPMDIARFELGIQEMAKSRSSDKTEEYKKMGAKAEGAAPRFQMVKDDGKTFLSLSKKEGTKSVTEQRAGHQIRKEMWEAKLDEGLKKERAKYARGAGAGIVASTEEMKLRAQLEKNGEEIVQFKMAVRALGIKEEGQEDSLLDLLATNRAMAETLKETVSGKQEKRTFEEQQALKKKADEEIEKAEGEDAEIQRLKADKDAKNTELNNLDESIKNLEASEAELGRRMAGLPKDFREAIKSFENAVNAVADTANKQQINEPVKDFEARKQRYINEEMTKKLDEYTTKNNIQGATPETLLKLKTEIEGKEKDIESQRAKREKVLKEHSVVKEQFTGRRMEILDKLSGEEKIPAWEAARAQSEREMQSRFYRTARSDMMNKASQIYIWDEKGIETPNTAYQELGDSLQKDFADMNYEATNANSESFRQKIIAKRAKGIEITLEDRAIGEALMMKQHGGAWIDDQILDMHNEDAKAWSEALHGGKDNKDNRRKILDTVKRHRRGSVGKNVGEKEMDDLSNVFSSLLGDQADALIEAFRPGNEIAAVRDMTDALKRKNVDIDKLDPNLLRSATGADVADSKEAISLLVKRLSNFDEYTRRMILDRVGKKKI